MGDRAAPDTVARVAGYNKLALKLAGTQRRAQFAYTMLPYVVRMFGEVIPNLYWQGCLASARGVNFQHSGPTAIVTVCVSVLAGLLECLAAMTALRTYLTDTRKLCEDRCWIAVVVSLVAFGP